MRTEPGSLLRIALEQTVDELWAEMQGVFSRETVERHVEAAYEQIGDRPTVGPNFLPVIIGRFARDQLWAVAQVHGRVPKALPEVLFVCEHNAGRSQMAAALTEHISRGWIAARSAGSHPEEQIEPEVLTAMSELGIDLSEEFPKPLTDAVVQAADVVVTMGCGDACPVLPAHRYLDWPVADPAGQPPEVVRAIRHDVYHRVWELIQELAPDADLLDLNTPDQGAT